MPWEPQPAPRSAPTPTWLNALAARVAELKNAYRLRLAELQADDTLSDVDRGRSIYRTWERATADLNRARLEAKRAIDAEAHLPPPPPLLTAVDRAARMTADERADLAAAREADVAAAAELSRMRGIRVAAERENSPHRAEVAAAFADAERLAGKARFELATTQNRISAAQSARRLAAKTVEESERQERSSRERAARDEGLVAAFHARTGRKRAAAG